MTTRINFCICFDLGYDTAFLGRFERENGKATYTRSKEMEYGSYDFEDAKSFKASVERYVSKYGQPTKIVLNGVDMSGIQAEAVLELILAKAL